MVLVIVAMVSALAAMRLAIHGQEVAVPALVGMAPGDAERTVSVLGLQMTIERHYYSPQIAEGRIMSQLPLPGTKVRHGWQVRVAQSLGPTRVAIPDVTGQSAHAAELNIRRREAGSGFEERRKWKPSGIPADQVLAARSPVAELTAHESLDHNPANQLVAIEHLPHRTRRYFVMPASFVGAAFGEREPHCCRTTGRFKLGNVTASQRRR